MKTGYPGLFIPGPTNIPERVRQAMDVPLEDQRAPDFPAFTLPLFADLKKVFKTDDRPGVPVSRLRHRRLGSGHHQHAVARRQGAVLGFGQFSHLWIDMCQRHGLDGRGSTSSGARAFRSRTFAQHSQGRRRGHTHQGGAGLPQRDRDRRDQRCRGRAQGARRRRASGAAVRRRRVSSIASIDFRMDEWGVDVARHRLAEGLHAADRARHRRGQPEGARGAQDGEAAALLLSTSPT